VDIVFGGDARADVEELADAGLAGERFEDDVTVVLARITMIPD